LHGIRRRTALAATTDVPDRRAVVPQRGEQQAVADVHVVDERGSHDAREHLARVRRIRQVDDHEASVRRVDGQERVQRPVHARDLGGVNTVRRVGRLIARDARRLERVREAVDDDRPVLTLGGDDEQRTVVRDLDVA